MKPFYATTAIPYVNGKPHIGHALEFVQADALTRYQRLRGSEALLLSGADENALKNVQAAEKAGEPIQKFVDERAEEFVSLAKTLNVEFGVFQKGSDSIKHYPASQKLWELCAAKGDIYKKLYKGLYCVGCESFKTEDDLNEKGECPDHNQKPIEVEEENYFFKLSVYREQLIDLISSDAYKITPETRKNEVLSFLSEDLYDISISRSNERAKNWGVPVPGDDSQRMYVWFDALNIYQSGIGFNWDEEMYKKWWPADLHVIGKDILRFHAVYWPAFLLSAGLELPKNLLVHGFVTSDGKKMSKTIGNVVDPFEVVEKYGVEAVRYYLLSEVPTGKDGDWSETRFIEKYNADLANGLGNLISRTAKLCEGLTFPASNNVELDSEFINFMEAYQIDRALEYVWGKIRDLDKYFNEKEPWKLRKEEGSEGEFKSVMEFAVHGLREISHYLKPFLPETAEKMEAQFESESVGVTESYFIRI